VERKTHRDSWTGEVSVKERFIVKEADVQSIMTGRFDMGKHRAKMVAEGTWEADIEEWEQHVDEICQAIDTKLLVPTMRTQ
jgi:SPX domain protein involved in polyphosphate accumulation